MSSTTSAKPADTQGHAKLTGAKRALAREQLLAGEPLHGQVTAVGCGREVRRPYRRDELGGPRDLLPHLGEHLRRDLADAQPTGRFVAYDHGVTLAGVGRRST
jgi:hypothetical protein